MHTVETIQSIMLSWGAGWVLWLLIFLSIASAGVAIERWLCFRRRSSDVKTLAAEIDAHLAEGDIDGALESLQTVESVGAAVVRSGLKLADRGPEAAERAMHSAMAVERKDLEDRLSFLGTLGNNAPFIGLFGTVIGVLLAFESLADKGGMASGAAQTAVMSAISEALVATAVGIAVALPAVAAYNYFQRRIAVMLDEAETLSNLTLAYLSDTSGKAKRNMDGEV